MENTQLCQLRSAEGVFGDSKDDEEGNHDDCLSGYHLQYKISTTIVNVVVLSFPDSSECGDNKEDDLIDKINDAQTIERKEDTLDPEQQDRELEAEDEIRQWVEAECQTAFRDIHAEAEPLQGPPTLHDYLHPNIVYLQVKTIDEKVTVIRHGDRPPWPSYMRLGHPDLTPVRLPENKRFPVYLSSQVTVVDSNGLLQVTTNDSNEVLRCKFTRTEHGVVIEHNTYMKLSTADASHPRIPKFKGCVKESTDAEAGVIGLLIENTDAEDAVLQNAMAVVGPSIPRDQPPKLVSIRRRRKWALQIREMIEHLHKVGTIWGDAKPDNVVIDRNDDAWLVDFGGGFTDPWVFFEHSMSEQGDLKALDKITEWLETGIEPPGRPYGRLMIDQVADTLVDNNVARGDDVDVGHEPQSKELLPAKRKRDAVEESILEE